MVQSEQLRIVSLLPSATEMVYELGLGDYLVGRTHCCDYPPDVLAKPKVLECALSLEGLSLAEIDTAVSGQLGSGQSVYRLNEDNLRTAAPTHILTQDLCQVCSASGTEVAQALKLLSPQPEVLWQTPNSFDDVLRCMEDLARATGRVEVAQAFVARARHRVARVEAKTSALPKTRVSFLEWVDPLFCGGHWMSEMIEWAGGVDANCRPKANSVRIPWEDIVKWQPEVLIVAPCGYKLEQSIAQVKLLFEWPGFLDLPCVKANRVYAVDANAHFARPGPRLVEGVELLAHLINPDVFAWDVSAVDFARVDVAGAA